MVGFLVACIKPEVFSKIKCSVAYSTQVYDMFFVTIE